MNQSTHKIPTNARVKEKWRGKKFNLRGTSDPGPSGTAPTGTSEYLQGQHDNDQPRCRPVMYISKVQTHIAGKKQSRQKEGGPLRALKMLINSSNTSPAIPNME